MNIPLEKATRLVNHGPVVMVSTTDGQRPNACAIAWCMPYSKKPAWVALKIGKSHLTWDNLMATEDLVINVPSAEQVEAVLKVGRVKGREVSDKLALAGLAPLPSEQVGPPRIAGCVAWLECRLVRRELAEADGIVLAEVVAAAAADGAFREDGTLDTERFPTLHHLGGDRFVADGRIIDLG